MLTITFGGDEHWDESANEFSVLGYSELQFEHSLLSLSKWESIFKKPFLSNADKSPEEIVTYIKTMCLTPEVSNETFLALSQDNLDDINKYIESSASATTFGEMPERKGRGEIITSELIYYWLVAFNIPFTCETWHINRLFALIKICNLKNEKPKKMSRHEIASRNRQLNAQRKAQLQTSG